MVPPALLSVEEPAERKAARHATSRSFRSTLLETDCATRWAATRTLDEARTYLASAQITPALYYARVMLGHAFRTGKARDIEKARLELMRALRTARSGRRTVRRRPPADSEPE
jgi:hypothetical protein